MPAVLTMSRFRIFGFLLACLLLAGACSAALQVTAVPPMTTQYGGSYFPDGVPAGSGAPRLAAAQNLTSAELEELLTQQDEEKFMRDSYRALSASYLTMPIWNTMAQTAETLLVYGNRLVPYDTSLEPGQYEHGDLTQLYRQYIGNAGPDPTDALTTAATLEDRHIAGLVTAMGLTTNPDVLDVYSRELSVARNNFRVILARLDAEGISYAPQYMNGQTYGSLVNTPAETVNMPVNSGSSASYAGAGIVPDVNSAQLRFADLPSGTLSATERADILYFQEMEKFERDLYQSLSEANPGLPVLAILAQSAGNEMAADDVILRKYGISYTPSDPGVFSSPNLQYEYDSLSGNISVLSTDVLGAAAEGEDLHVADLTAAIRRTDNPDLLSVYNHQLSLARNNLREVVSELRARGGTYSPRYISMDYFNAIIGSPVEPVG